jgi:hypothetical protein
MVGSSFTKVEAASAIGDADWLVPLPYDITTFNVSASIDNHTSSSFAYSTALYSRIVSFSNHNINGMCRFWLLTSPRTFPRPQQPWSQRECYAQRDTANTSAISRFPVK